VHSESQNKRRGVWYSADVGSREPAEETHSIRPLRPGLTFKLVVPLTIGMCVVLAAHFATTIRRERLLFEKMKGQYGRLIGHALAQRLAENWNEAGSRQARTLQQELDDLGDHVTMRWVSSDRDAGSDSTPALTATERESLLRGDPVTIQRREGDRESLFTYVPVPAPGEGFVVVVDAFSDRDFYLRASVRRFFLALVLIVALNALLALWLSTYLVSRPFSRLIAKARQVGSGNLGVPVSLRRRDEIGILGREMDRMSQSLLEADARVRSEEAARLRAERELQHAERLATLGKLAAGVAHELGTPLNVISGRAKRVARQHVDDADIQENVSIIGDQVDRVTHIVRQLLQFARRRKLNKTRVDLRALVRTTVAELQPTIDPRIEFELRLDGAPRTQTEIDAGQIQQVLTNLVMNGAQAMPDGGRLTISLSPYRTDPPAGQPGTGGDYLCLRVADQGHGITDTDLPHIFEPFFTTKDIGGGTGLGLAVSQGIVQDHGGWIDVDTEVGTGTSFGVCLPCCGSS
jgi:signal transduction histidine kinase